MLLTISDLVTEFAASRSVLRAVDHVSLTLERGEVLGLVGESGSGKSVIAQSIMGLIEPPGRIAGGQIRFDGQDLLRTSRKTLRQWRGARIAMVFQDPTSTLNPVLTIGEQVAELLRHHTKLNRAERRARVIAMLGRVGIADAGARYHAYPHELSGGMQQRVIIACALIMHPELVIADEPTTALDVTVQAQILDVLRRLKESERNTAVLLITHDLGVVAQMCQRVAVIYAGRIVEMAPTRQILHRPRHPYTAGLIASLPRPGTARGALRPIPGAIADPLDRPAGCPFHPRCHLALPRCATEPPPLTVFPDGASVACHLAGATP